MTKETKKKILVVDDEKDIVELIKDYLQHKHSDYVVLSAQDGEDALKVAVKEKPNLITLDIMMANKDGYETCLLLRENDVTSDIPIIILTGRGTKQAQLAAQSFGADHYLSKPFQLDELDAVIHEYMK